MRKLRHRVAVRVYLVPWSWARGIILTSCNCRQSNEGRYTHICTHACTQACTNAQKHTSVLLFLSRLYGSRILGKNRVGADQGLPPVPKQQAPTRGRSDHAYSCTASRGYPHRWLGSNYRVVILSLIGGEGQRLFIQFHVRPLLPSTSSCLHAPPRALL